MAVIKISIPGSWLNDMPCCSKHHNRITLHTQQEHNFLRDYIFFSCRHKSRQFCVSLVFLQIHFFPILCTLHKWAVTESGVSPFGLSCRVYTYTLHLSRMDSSAFNKSVLADKCSLPFCSSFENMEVTVHSIHINTGKKVESQLVRGKHPSSNALTHFHTTN